MIRYVLVWIPMLAIAVANGALRQLVFVKGLSEPHAHQLSTLTGAIFIGAFIWFIIRKWPPSSGEHALLIGLVWVFLTIIFESSILESAEFSLAPGGASGGQSPSGLVAGEA